MPLRENKIYKWEPPKKLPYRRLLNSLKKKWKTPRHIKSITVTSECIGEGHIGRVFVGKARWADGKVSKVAVKRFKKPLDDKMAARYAQTINDLKKAGVLLPKMAMVKLEKGTLVCGEKLDNDEWVQVSQFFGSASRGVKVGGTILFEESRAQKMDSVREATKIANAGYSIAFDVLSHFSYEKSGAIPLDIDVVVRDGKLSLGERVRLLTNFISHIGPKFEESAAYIRFAWRYASPELKPALKNDLERAVMDALKYERPERALVLEKKLEQILGGWIELPKSSK